MVLNSFIEILPQNASKHNSQIMDHQEEIHRTPEVAEVMVATPSEDGENSVTDAETTDSLKRGSEQVEGGQDNKRRRFLWPDSLNRDFMAAVFDVGLKNASPDLILEVMCREDPKCAVSTDRATIEAHLIRFLLLRDRTSTNYCSYFERAILEGSISSDQLHMHHRKEGGMVASSKCKNGEDKLALGHRLSLLKKQLELVSDTIKVQSKFLTLVKTSMQSHLKSQANIIQVISKLDPSYAAPLQNNNQQQQQLLSALPTYSALSEFSDMNKAADPAASSKRVELQIMSEMRTHMDLHRQLLMRKEDQVSQFNVKQSDSELVKKEEPMNVDWIWDEERLDEQLFNFLDDT